MVETTPTGEKQEEKIKNKKVESWEGTIVPAVWEDRDTDYVAHHEIYKKLGLKGVSELTLD